MDQLSFFDTGLLPVTPADLGVVLLAHGQSQLLFGNIDTTRGKRKKPHPQSARISILLSEEWRATCLDKLAQHAGLAVIVESQSPVGESPSWLVRMEGAELLPVVQQWTKGAVKTVPVQWQPTATTFKVWATVAGVQDEMGFRLGLDMFIAEHASLVTIVQEALVHAGLGAVVVGARAGGPALRVHGQRRLRNLYTMIGEAPSGHSWKE